MRSDTLPEDGQKSEERLAAEAAEWLERAPLTEPDQQRAFLEWITRSEAHTREFLGLAYWRTAVPGMLERWTEGVTVAQLLSASNIVDITDRTGNSNGSPRTLRGRRGALWGLGAGIAALLLVLLTPLADLIAPNVYVTALGEQRTVPLSDGSTVALNTRSRISVSYSDEARDVYLTQGQATFAVAHDSSRPFRVHTDTAVIQALGTRFDVRQLPDDHTRVAVIEGRIEIRPNSGSIADLAAMGRLSESVRIAAGEGIEISRERISPPAPVDIAQVSAWQQRRLVFVDHPLREILDEFARYNQTQIRIEGEGVADQRYSGIWDADRPDVLIAYLRTFGNVTVTEDDDGFVIRPLQPAP